MPLLASLRRVAIAACLLPAAAWAQVTGAQMPASFVLPNYDRVFVGLSEAHEAGAYLVRTSGPAANWYNPAGIASVDSTAVSINIRGLNVGALSVGGRGLKSTQFSAVDVLPLFAACVLGPEILPWPDVRLGLSVTQQGASSTLAWWGDTEATGHWTYVSDSSLSSYLVAASLAWSVSPRLRLGGSLGGSWTGLYQNDRLSALTATGDVQGTVRTRVLSGYALHAVPSLAVQWQLAEPLAVGAVVRAPALRLWSQASLQVEQQDSGQVSSRNAFLQTGHADFDYRFPLELDGGVAWREGRWELEFDARYHASTGSYPLAATSVPVGTVTTPPGGAPAQSPFAPIVFQGKAVVDLALGGSWAPTKATRIHGGVYVSPSPVATGSSQFRQTDLYGIRIGFSLEGEKLSGSVGFGYETGLSSASPRLIGVAHTPMDDRVRVDQFSLVFAGQIRS